MAKKAKEPLFAIFLFVFLPGLGQAYSGRIIKGLLFFVIIAALNAGGILYFLKPQTRLNWQCCVPAVVSILAFLFCLLDAYLSARKFNIVNQVNRRNNFAVAAFLTGSIVILILSYVLIIPMIVSFSQDYFSYSYIVPANSMEPAIYKQDRILINMRAYNKSAAQRGDVVIYRCPDEPKEVYLHRIVGLPGESVLLKDNRVFINGKKITAPWSGRVRYYNGGKLARRDMKAIIIPQDSYFILGDSSSKARDSRYFGCVHKKFLIGKAYKIYYPFNRSGPIE